MPHPLGLVQSASPIDTPISAPPLEGKNLLKCVDLILLAEGPTVPLTGLQARARDEVSSYIYSKTVTTLGPDGIWYAAIA